MFEKNGERQSRKAYKRLYNQRNVNEFSLFIKDLKKSEMRIQELKEKLVQEELKECSFHPVINKDYKNTEAFYEKIFLELDSFL